jgi:hypothetical protein
MTNWISLHPMAAIKILLALLFIPMVAGCEPTGRNCTAACPEDEDVGGLHSFDVYKDSFDVYGFDVSGADTSSD